MSANTVAAEILDTSAQAFARQSNVRFHEYLADSDLELTENPDGSIVRRVSAVPPAEIPAAVKKVIGDSAGYVEEG
ncbi:MAG: hypothetical protein ACWGPN_17800, partial [Gammaproteobacteria bacterium]